MSDTIQSQREKKQTKPNNNRSGASSGKLRGLPSDSAEVRLSKTLSWLLRHGAASQGLAIRADGYAKVNDILDNPKLKSQALTLEMLKEIVDKDVKKRYDLRCVEDVDCESIQGVWLIRANQGHSMKNVTDLELVQILSVDDIPTKTAVHGTTAKAWLSIAKEGLSKMTRNHIHLAQGVTDSDHTVISGMRRSSQILIYINIPKAISEGNLTFFISSNGVVLSEGDDEGFIRPPYFERVVDMRRGNEVTLVFESERNEWIPAQASGVHET